MSETIRMPAFRAAGSGLTRRHVAVTDELLDYLAERFIERRVREAWERIAQALKKGFGVRYYPEFPEVVTLIAPAAASGVR